MTACGGHGDWRRLGTHLATRDPCRKEVAPMHDGSGLLVPCALALALALAACSADERAPADGTCTNCPGGGLAPGGDGGGSTNDASPGSGGCTNCSTGGGSANGGTGGSGNDDTCAVPSTTGKTYYVDPSGNDETGDGSDAL